MIKIGFYAQLKDFFGDEAELEIPPGAVASDIRAALAAKNALAAEWLKVSRLASDDAFVAEDEILSANKYYLLPPSSGG